MTELSSLKKEAGTVNQHCTMGAETISKHGRSLKSQTSRGDVRKMQKFSFLLAFVIITLFASSCTVRLVDFTIISSKVHSVYIEKSLGVKTTGKCMKFAGWGANIKDALDNALENAGIGYDLLIDGVVRARNGLFVSGYIVEGIAINSAKLKAELGEDGFNEWLLKNNVYLAGTEDIDKDSNVFDQSTTVVRE